MSYININNFSITGDCGNTSSGAVYFEVSGSAPNWVVTEVGGSGLLPTSALTPSSYTYFVDNLPFGNYSLTVTDSAIPTADIYPVAFPISTGTTIHGISKDTTCNQNNGSITAYTQYNYSISTFNLYEFSGNFVTSGQSLSTNNYHIFNNLSAGTYYLTGDDGGGCSGQSESILVRPSTIFSYGYYAVDDASCIPGQGSGKIFITGLTHPTSAYTINWVSNVNGQTGTVVTGLTQGLYTVSITDVNGCVNTQSVPINNIPPVGLGSIVAVTPTCFNNDGSITLIITGGTAPYYYSGSNGNSVISFDTSYTFTGLTSNLYTFAVTDAGLCSFTTQTTLVTPGSFGTVNISTVNSNCNSNNGSVIVSVNNGAGSGTFTYTLSGNTGQSAQTSVAGQTQTFNGVGSGDYVVLVSDNAGCVYTGTTTIINTDKFTISAATTGTTCGLKNGSVIVSTSTGATLPLSYNLYGPTIDPFPASITQATGNYQNLGPGNYTLAVTDAAGCKQTTNVYISPSSNVFFTFLKSDPVTGNDGSINVILTSGNPPFTYNWSPNVGSQTGLSVTGLTAGLYSLLVTDSSGCQYTSSITLKGTQILDNYEFVNICEKPFEPSPVMGIRGIPQMFNEGYYDLTSGDTNCILNSAQFKLSVQVGDTTAEQIFYSSTTLNDYPSTYLWGQTIQSLLQSFVGIGEVQVDFLTNSIKIFNDCEEIQKNCRSVSYNLLTDTRIIVNMVIIYDISCVSCGPL